jgi:hypothetical protein
MVTVKKPYAGPFPAMQRRHFPPSVAAWQNGGNLAEFWY